MNTIVILFLLGILLLCVEVFMPGAVLGILGCLAMGCGCAVAFIRLGASGGFIASGVALGVLALALLIEFVVVPRTRFGRQMFVQSKVESVSQAPVGTDALIGKECEAVTTLAPSGYVMLAGRRYEAFCPGGHVSKGTILTVTGHDNFRIIVNQKST